MAADVQLVKSLGDAVMLAATSSPPKLDTVELLAARCRAEPGFLTVRGGLHHGPAVAVDGDYFGHTINVAARVTGLACGGEIVMTAAIVADARATGRSVADLGPVRLRNVADPVEVYVWELDSLPVVVDPVCRMRVDPSAAAGRLRHDGRDWWFCSLDCVTSFAAAPREYVAILTGDVQRRGPSVSG